MTTRTAPPTRRSTCASLVSQPCSACHQRRITSGLVHASNTASAGAWTVRWIRSVWAALTAGAPACGAGGAPARRAPPTGRRSRRPAPAASPRAARRPHAPSRACAPRAALRGGGLRQGGLEDVRLVVLVVQVPPAVGRGLRVALGLVLPLLLAAERGDVEVGPGAAHRLVAAAVDEVGAVHLIAVADERVRAVPLADAEIRVEVAGDRVPGDVPAHPRLQPRDVLLRAARGER